MTNDLARRALACKGWRWMPGMLQVVTPKQAGGTGCVIRYDGIGISGALPDLTDPAMLGCLLALVREAWDDAHMHVGRRIAWWGVWTSQSTPFPLCVGKGDTEAEALVAALEAAERQGALNE